jgi:hypothetical protein
MASLNRLDSLDGLALQGVRADIVTHGGVALST